MISIKSLDSPINPKQYGNMTYRQYADTYNIDDRKVPYGPDMFYLSISIIAHKNFTFAVDEDGKLVAALVFNDGTYAHKYTYTGGVDTAFIDNYECIFLYDCNEFSVELCKTALRVWKGKRLVLVGTNWDRMIEYLDDIPNVECFYEPEPSDRRFEEIIN